MKRLIVLLAALATAHVSAQSLGDLAKKTQDERKVKDTTTTETKVYTNKDLKEPLQGGVGTTPNPVTAETPPPVAVPTTAPNFKKDEAYWRDRMRAVFAKVDDDQGLLDAAIARERDLDRRLHKSTDNADYIRERLLRTSVDMEWTQAVAEVSRLKAAVANDRRAVKTAEEEARRADVPPAWLVRVQ